MIYTEVFQANPPTQKGFGAKAAKVMEDWYAPDYKNKNQDDNMF